MRVRLGTPTCHHVTTLAATSSQLDLETLAACEVLANPHAVFHSYTCRLRGGVVMVSAAMIGYDDMEVVAGTTTRRR
jgi:hypothetical protein